MERQWKIKWKLRLYRGLQGFPKSGLSFESSLREGSILGVTFGFPLSMETTISQWQREDLYNISRTQVRGLGFRV